MCRRARVVAAVAALAPAPAPAAPPRRAIVAFYDASPRDVLVHPPGARGRPLGSLLRMLGAEPGLRAGLWSSSQGSYQRQQVLLDVSQGARQPTGLYGDVDGRRRRARQPASRPGAACVRELGGLPAARPRRLAHVAPGPARRRGSRRRGLRRRRRRAAAPCDRGSRRGRTRRRAVARLRWHARRSRVGAVAPAADGRRVAAGRPCRPRAAVGARARRVPGELLLVIQLPETPRAGAFGEPPRRYLRQLAFAIGDGRSGSPTSGSTRRDGLVSSIDFAPAVRRWLGVRPPNSMRGLPIETGSELGVERLDALRARWANTRDGRQAASFMAIVTLAGIVFLLLGTWRGIDAATRPTLRIGALGILWWPSAVLLAALVEPTTRAGEACSSRGWRSLAVLSERLLPWARAPLVPALACLVAYATDLALGGPLLTVSVLGPSVASGSRFYGVSNELEPILPIVLLVGLAALTSQSTSACRAAAI
jgi:hypothetical protein